MADVAKLIYEGQPTQADTLLYTAGSTGTVVRGIRACNTTGLSASFTLGLNAGGVMGATTHFYSAFVVLPNAVEDWSGFQFVTGSSTVRALQGTTAAITLTISGIEL